MDKQEIEAIVRNGYPGQSARSLASQHGISRDRVRGALKRLKADGWSPQGPPLPNDAKPIPGFPDYSVTEDGQVWRVSPAKTRAAVPYPLTGTTHELGYTVVLLTTPEGKKRSVGVHRLVLMAHKRPPRKGEEACHNDGDSSNNRLNNLRWDTCKGNQSDRVKHGTSNRGEANGRAKLAAKDVIEIRRMFAENGASVRDVAGIFGVSCSTIDGIRAGRLWRSLDEDSKHG